MAKPRELGPYICPDLHVALRLARNRIPASFFIAYLLVLSWADYSFVQPASATSYAVVALLGHFALKETISPMRWLGVLVICSGVLVVGNTHPRTTEHK